MGTLNGGGIHRPTPPPPHTQQWIAENLHSLDHSCCVCLSLSPIVQEQCESRGVRPNEPSGFRRRKDILNHASALVTACP